MMQENPITTSSSQKIESLKKYEHFLNLSNYYFFLRMLLNLMIEINYFSSHTVQYIFKCFKA